MSRGDALERHGHVYGGLRLAIAFTESLEADGAKRVRTAGWDKTKRLPDASFGAALLRNRGERCNPAVVLGPSGLIGIDVDGPEGVEHLQRLVSDGMPRTVTVETGKDSGYHLWYRRPQGSAIAFVELGPEGVTAKRNQYLVCPPAVHPSGRVYRFADGRAPWELVPALLPTNILDKLERAARGERQRRAEADGSIAAGGRHDHLMRLGCAMRRRGASFEAVETALVAENAARCQPPKPVDTVRELARDLYGRYGPKTA
jgi:putative DNA primase/helicase